MDQPIAEKHREVASDEDPYRIMPRSAGSPYVINPITGGIEFLSPPGTPPVTSEDVRRLLEDFP